MRQWLIHLMVAISAVACTTAGNVQMTLPEGTKVRSVADCASCADTATSHSGVDGKDGRDGRDGAVGRMGEKGETGVPGERGRDGLSGRDGAAGRDGTDGRDGVRGRDGRDGSNGRDGRDGAAGAAGVNAVSMVPQPTPLQVLLGDHASNGCCAGPGESQPPSGRRDDHPWWLNLILAILGGIGAFVTACTPLLLGLAKLYADQKGGVDRAAAQHRAATQRAPTDEGKNNADSASTQASATDPATPPSVYILGWKPVAAAVSVVFLGGCFFAYLLVMFAVALLIFICAFMLSSGALLIAFAYAYKVIGESDMQRERHGLQIARLSARQAKPRTKAG
jgi:Collagen triple helix repeat (20 copies)